MSTRPQKLQISDPKARKLLSNIKAIEVLQVFSLKPKTISEAALELKVSISNCQYWVKQLLEQGLLSIAFKKSRSGSPIKYYWLKAEQLIVDIEPSLLEDYFKTLLTIYSKLTLEGLPQQMLERDLDYKIQVIPNSQGLLRFRLMRIIDNKIVSSSIDLLKPESSAFLARFGSLEISHSDAKALQREMFGLINKYRAKAVQGQKTYFFQTIIAAKKD